MNWRRSVFWKVAGVLVGVQVAIGLLAVGLSYWLALDRSLALVENSLRQRLDTVAREVEERLPPQANLEQAPLPLRIDLSNRFPDPVTLLDGDGAFIAQMTPLTEAEGEPSVFSIPDSAITALLRGDVRVHLQRPLINRSWGIAPIYDRDNLPIGGILVYPMAGSVDEELAGAREGFQRALWLVVALAGFIALLLGIFFTGRLVRPLRRMNTQIAAIEAGDYTSRINLKGEDELGQLATSINEMAGAVEQSINTLKMTDQLRRELIANIGHDLRTPLAALLGYAEEAERYLNEGKPDQAMPAIQTARQQGQYIQKLIQDLFELSVLDHGLPQLRREPIPIAELLHEAARSHQGVYEKAGLTLKIELEPNLPIVFGDGVRLLRVMNNLLSNARRHTPTGGHVWVRAHTAGEQLRVQVTDTGEGMTDDVQAHVFDRYYRGQEARTRTTERSTGLGLAISLAIARTHGGDLTVESEAGQGSTFTLILPVKS